MNAAEAIFAGAMLLGGIAVAARLIADQQPRPRRSRDETPTTANETRPVSRRAATVCRRRGDPRQDEGPDDDRAPHEQRHHRQPGRTTSRRQIATDQYPTGRYSMPGRSRERSPVSCLVGPLTKRLDFFRGRKLPGSSPTCRAVCRRVRGKWPKTTPLSTISRTWEITSRSDRDVHIKFASNHIKMRIGRYPGTVSAGRAKKRAFSSVPLWRGERVRVITTNMEPANKHDAPRRAATRGALEHHEPRDG